MSSKDEIKSAGQGENPEIILKQHRRWTRWMEGSRTMGEGSLILTNRRLLFLHRIEASPSIAASIKKLADAPMETVLDHALTLHKNCFQIPLSSIIKVEIGISIGFPFPYFYLGVLYLHSRKLTPHTAAFHFKRPKFDISFQPQLIADWSWKRAIQRAIQQAG